MYFLVVFVATSLTTTMLMNMGGHIGKIQSSITKCIRHSDKPVFDRNGSGSYPCIEHEHPYYSVREGERVGHRVGLLDGAFMAIKMTGRFLMQVLAQYVVNGVDGRRLFTSLMGGGVEIASTIAMAYLLYPSLTGTGLSQSDVTGIALISSAVDVTAAFIGEIGIEPDPRHMFL